MQTINVLVYSDLPGGMASYEDAEVQVHFHRQDPAVRGIAPPAPCWAFIGWDQQGLTALETSRRLRCDPQWAHVHIVIQLGEDSPKTRRRCAQVGVEDYLSEIVTREAIIAKIMKRSDYIADRQFQSFGDLTIDVSASQVRWRDRPIALMPVQLRLLKFFADNPGKILTRKQLIDALGSLETRMEERTVDVWIGRLRLALKKAGASGVLRTVRSLGYMLVPA